MYERRQEKSPCGKMWLNKYIMDMCTNTASHGLDTDPQPPHHTQPQIPSPPYQKHKEERLKKSKQLYFWQLLF
jgi:hypothetical protein